MRLTVNGNPVNGQPQWRLTELLLEVSGQREPDGTAVAINEEVVPRGQWAKTELKDGDRIEILGAVSGG